MHHTSLSHISYCTCCTDTYTHQNWCLQYSLQPLRIVFQTVDHVCGRCL